MRGDPKANRTGRGLRGRKLRGADRRFDACAQARLAIGTVASLSTRSTKCDLLCRMPGIL